MRKKRVKARQNKLSEKDKAKITWGCRRINQNRYGKHAEVITFINNPSVPYQQRKAVLDTLTSSQLFGLSELARQHLFHDTYRLNRSLVNHLLKIADPSIKLNYKKKLLKQKGGLFWGRNSLPLKIASSIGILATKFPQILSATARTKKTLLQINKEREDLHKLVLKKKK